MDLHLDLEAARIKHQDLILGLVELLDVLVKMRYISSGDVRFPPHNSTHVQVDIDHLRGLGFDRDAIAVAHVIPQLRHEIVWGWQEEGTDIAPNSKALNFLAKTGFYHELQDDIREAKFSYLDGAEELPPWVMRLTNGAPTNFGVHMLYNAREGYWKWAGLSSNYVYDLTNASALQGTIIEFRVPMNSRNVAQGWQTSPTRPSGVVLSEMVARIRNLDWVPFFHPNDDYDNKHRRLLESPSYRYLSSQPQHPRPFQEACPSLGDDLTALQHVTQRNGDGFEAWSFRNELNYWHALRRLYLECGWNGEDGGESFDGDRLEASKNDFAGRASILRRPANKAASELEQIDRPREVLSVLPPDLRQMGLPPIPDSEELRAARTEAMQAYAEVLREAAGDRAV